MCAPYIVRSDPGPSPRVVCTSAQIRENPAQRGRKVEESSGIAADSRRTQHVVIPRIEIPMRGTAPTWGKMFGVRPVIAPRRCLFSLLRAVPSTAPITTNGYAEQSAIYALSSESTIWTPKCDLA